MAVNQEQITIDPYKSTVPVPPVQIPQQDLQPQQASAIYSKTGGIAQMADGVMKGMLKGLQMKETRKYETAQAVMQAQDAGISAAKKNYDDMLTTKGAFEADGKTPKAETQAAYAAWQTAVNAAAAQRQAFAIPEKGVKQPKKTGEKGKGKTSAPADGAPMAGGFGAGLKQFFERNPHIVPELAIIGMKSQVTPYGQMGPEQQQQKIQMDALQRQESIQKGTDEAVLTRKKYAGRSESELEKTPPSEGGKAAGFNNALEEYRNAVEYLTPIKPTTKSRVVVNEKNPDEFQTIPEDAQIPTGYKPYEKTSAVSQSNLYYDAAAREWGTTRDKLTIPQLEYVDASRARSQAQARGQATYSYRTTDANGNSSTVTKKVSEPIAAPQGVKALPEKVFRDGQEDSQTGSSSSTPRSSSRGFRPPAAPGAGRGNFAAGLPTQDGKPTLTTANRTMHVETQEKGMYDKASKAYQDQINKNRSKAADPASLDKLNKEAEQAYNAAKAQIVLWKAGQIKAVGGDPWKHQATDGKGNIYGTMDGTNWVNINTGYPYQEQ